MKTWTKDEILRAISLVFLEETGERFSLSTRILEELGIYCALCGKENKDEHFHIGTTSTKL